MSNKNSGGYEPSFYDDNWTVLQKIIYLTKFAKGNIVDLASLEFTYTEPDEQGKYSATITGTTFTGEKTTIATVPMYVGAKGDPGTPGAKGDPGTPGNGVVSIHTLSHSTVGNETVNNVEAVYSDGDSSTFPVYAQNGTDGAGLIDVTEGTPETGVRQTTTPLTFTLSDGTKKDIKVYAQNGNSVAGATAGTPTQSGGNTITPITFTDPSGGEISMVNVQAKNGNSLFAHVIHIKAQSGIFDCEGSFTLYDSTFGNSHLTKSYIWQNLPLVITSYTAGFPFSCAAHNGSTTIQAYAICRSSTVIQNEIAIAYFDRSQLSYLYQFFPEDSWEAIAIIA